MQLPPKRFQDDNDPKYDAIRHHQWFSSLGQRRKKLYALANAAGMLAQGAGMTMASLCENCGVDERELRDYMDFVHGRSRFSEISDPRTQKVFQMLLDQAYDVYRDIGAQRSFAKVIYEESRLFGINARQVVELWDIDPAFYPTQYRGER